MSHNQIGGDVEYLYNSISFTGSFKQTRDRMPAVRGDGMRGLAVFISDIRNCKYFGILIYTSDIIFSYSCNVQFMNTDCR